LPGIDNNSGYTLSLTAANVPYNAGGPNAVVTANPEVDLPDGLVIAWCRVSATNTIKISFRNTSNVKITVGVIQFDLTIVKS
ncbi:MAG TPA: hypothetical protein VN958_05035, partial [Chitinophagaceae bacterium]|nr:hypothetical protein [Chitinophagaceae bacterium]